MKDSFCVLPWVNLSTDVNGSLRPCCKFAQPAETNEFQLPNMRDGNIDVLWNHSEFQRLRQAFLDNKAPKECQSCWNEEAAGIRSFRQDFAINKRLDLSTVDFSPKTSSTPLAIDLKLNNICNLKCRICGAQASSTYVKEYEEFKGIKLKDAAYWISNKIYGTPNEAIFKDWIKSIRHVEMTGGEPFVSPENIKILSMCIESGHSQNMTLMINTNCTQYNKKFIELLAKFKKVKICLSIDDIKERIEYQRYPTNWNTILENFQQFIETSEKFKNIAINITPTVSIFNIFYLPEFMEWIKNFKYSFLYFNMLHYSSHQSVKNLPVVIKKILTNRLSGYSELTPVINFMNIDGDDSLMRTFFETTEELDKFRNQSFKNVFNEWYLLLKEQSYD